MAAESTSAGTLHEIDGYGVMRYDLTSIREDAKGAEATGFCEALHNSFITTQHFIFLFYQELHKTGFALLRTPEAMHNDIDAIQDAVAGAL